MLFPSAEPRQRTEARQSGGELLPQPPCPLGEAAGRPLPASPFSAVQISAAAVYDLTIRPITCRSKPIAMHADAPADEAFRASPERAPKRLPPDDRLRGADAAPQATYLPFGPP